jgi:hypothetical protein
MQIVNRVQSLENDALDLTLGKELLLHVHDVHQVAQVHFAKFEHQEDALAFGPDHDFLQSDHIRVRAELLQVVQNVDFAD